MKWLNLSMPDLDWRQPCALPVVYQRVLFGVVAVWGVLLVSPWWLSGWQAWINADEAQPKVAFVDAEALTTLARQQGLQFSQLGLDKPVQTPALNATQLQQVPVHLQVQGSWAAWLAWFELSSPRVVTADQAKTVIEQGTELPYQVAAASGPTTLAFRKANFKLRSRRKSPLRGASCSTWIFPRTT